MAVRDYIPIEKENIPELFEFDFDERSFLFGINYSESQDLFSVDLYDEDENPIVLGERLILNEKLWSDIVDDRLPSIDVVPMDESGKETMVTWDNFQVTVFIYFDDLPPDADFPNLDEDVDMDG